MPTINEPAYNDKLEDTLEMLAAGTPLDEVLASANSDAEWLAPMLETAAEVAELQQSIPIPPPEASLQRLLAYGEELTAVSQPVPSPDRWRLFSGWGTRLSMGIAAVLLLMAILLGGLNFAAQDSLPGELLFPIKKAGETLQLNLPWNFEQRQQLLDRFNARRQNEVKLLLEQDQPANVAFSGSVTALASTTLIVDDFTVEITPKTEIRGKVTIGARIHLNGLTQPPGKLIALTITVIEPGVPALETPSPTPTYPPTQTFSPTPETLSLPIPTSTPTPIIVDSLASPDTPTASPTPPPTATPTTSLIKTTPADDPINDDISDADNSDNIDDSIDNDVDNNDTEDLNNNEDTIDNSDDGFDVGSNEGGVDSNEGDVDNTDDGINDSSDDDFGDFYDDGDNQNQNSDSSDDATNDNLDDNDNANDDDANNSNDNDNDNS